MKPMTTSQIAHVVHGKLLQGSGDTLVSGVSIDNRTLEPGDLFIAFTGSRTDGHRFIPDAFRRGASAALVSHDQFPQVDSLPIIQVTHPLTAVQQLASYERTQYSGPVIGITGSNGKTTSKEMLRTVFQTAGPCLYTPANLNNELGLPLTILQRKQEHGSIILEMGMRGPGQIAALCEISKPTAGWITNIGHSHIELLGNQERIASAKAELLDALPENGIAVLNGDDPWLRKVVVRLKGKPYWYGLSESADAYATEIQMDGRGTRFVVHMFGHKQEVYLPTLGMHNVHNALGALLMGRLHGLGLEEMVGGLTTFSAAAGRLNFVKGKRDCLVIDDCYNASPASMQASLSVLRQVGAGRETVAILGDMYELGHFEEEGHRLVGQYVVEQGIDLLIAVGPKAKWIAEAAQERGHQRVTYYPDKSSLLHALEQLPTGSAVLVKASRGMQLEEAVHLLADPKGQGTIH